MQFVQVNITLCFMINSEKNNYEFNSVDFMVSIKHTVGLYHRTVGCFGKSDLHFTIIFFSASNKSESSPVFCSHPTCHDEMTTNMTHCIWQIFLCLHNVKSQWQKTVWGPVMPNHLCQDFLVIITNWEALGLWATTKKRLGITSANWLLSSSKYLISRWFPVLPKELLPGIHIESLSPMFFRHWNK